MKKITFLIVLLCATILMSAQSVTLVWENSRANETLPDLTAIDGGNWSLPSTGGTARKFAVGTMNGNERVFIFTRSGDGIVLIYNANNGNYVGKMQGSISGGLVNIGDGDVTEDGKLIVTNVTAHNATGEFKVYMWSSETSDPVTLFTYNTSNSRYGDNVFIEGNYDLGTAKIYATKKVAGKSKVLCWSMEVDPLNAGKFRFNPIPKETIEVVGTNKAANVCSLPSGGILYKESGIPLLVQYDTNNDSINVSPDDLLLSHGVTPRHVGTFGNDQIVAYFRYFGAAGDYAPSGMEECRVELLKLPNGDLSQASSIVKTKSLGNVKNLNGWGDIVVKKLNENEIEIYAFSAYNGFGKYLIDLTGEPSGDGDIVIPGDDDDDDDVKTEWQLSIAKANMPAGWTYRKIAVGNMGQGERVFAAKGAGSVVVFNAENGQYVRDLTGTIAKTALLAVGDLGMTDDGKLLVSNVSAHNASSPFQVYMWDNENSEPTKVIEHTFSNLRFGDNIFVEGNYDLGTAKVYATRKIDYNTYYKVLCWSMVADNANPGKFKFNDTPAETIEVIGGAIQWAGVSTLPGGGFLYKDGGNLNDASATRLQYFDEAYDFMGDANPGIVTRHSNNPRFAAKDGNDLYVILYRYYPSAGTSPVGEEESRAELFKIPNGDISEIESVALTPSLGNVSDNNGWGSVVAKTEEVDGQTDMLIYVSSATNGFGKYRIENVYAIGEDDPNAVVSPFSHIQVLNKKGSLEVIGLQNPQIEIYNMMGHRVLSQYGQNIPTNQLHGLHIVNIKTDGQSVKTVKLVF